MPDPFDFYLSSPTLSGDAVYFGSGDGNVYSLDAASGKLNWKFQTEDVVHASPAASNGVIFIGSWDSYFYAIDASTGKQNGGSKPAKTRTLITRSAFSLPQPSLTVSSISVAAIQTFMLWMPPPAKKSGVSITRVPG